MGKNIGLAVLVLLLIGGVIWQSVYIKCATDELTNSLIQVREALKRGDADAALQKADEFDALWEQEKSTYEALFEHKEVDTISAKARSLTGLCTDSTLPHALSLTDEMLFYLDHIYCIDCLSWENIF
ncbi:MAG: DUF4363 family protein [Christensenellales bacterium]|jgi:hypothetical protein